MSGKLKAFDKALRGLGLLGKSKTVTGLKHPVIDRLKVGKRLKEKRDIQDSVVTTKDKIMSGLSDEGKYLSTPATTPSLSFLLPVKSFLTLSLSITGCFKPEAVLLLPESPKPLRAAPVYFLTPSTTFIPTCFFNDIIIPCHLS